MSIPSDWSELTAFQRDILLTLHIEGEMPGVDVHEHLDDVAKPTTYANLKRLREFNLVEADPGNGHTNVQRLTDRGERLIAAVEAKLTEAKHG